MTELEKKKRAYLFFKALLRIVVIGTAVVLVIGMGVTVYDIRATQVDNKKNTQITVTTITNVVIATKFCGYQLPKTATVSDITSCVQNVLAKGVK